MSHDSASKRTVAVYLLSTCLSGVVPALITPAPAHAAEQTIQNDTFEAGQEANLFADFTFGEQAAVWLTSPCDGNIVAVQIGWFWDQDNFPDPGQTLEESIFIYQGATFPNPGSVLQELVGPVLTPGGLNEFRTIDENETPLSVPVSLGQTFVVALEFANDTDVENGTASVFSDVNGCNSGTSAVFSFVWFDLCPLLVTKGNIVIRAVVDCAEPPGACCDAAGGCADNVDQANCQAPGQTFFGGQACTSVTCPEPTGACCGNTGGCLNDVTQSFCQGLEGALFAGPNTTCESGICGLGACCIGTSCAADQTDAGCTGFGGNWQGPLTTCSPVDPCVSNCALADINCDGSVNLLDFATFSRCFGEPVASPPPACSTAEAELSDLNTDGIVNLLDFGIFALNFGG